MKYQVALATWLYTYMFMLLYGPTCTVQVVRDSTGLFCPTLSLKQLLICEAERATTTLGCHKII